jgi:hypothetical protein
VGAGFVPGGLFASDSTLRAVGAVATKLCERASIPHLCARPRARDPAVRACGQTWAVFDIFIGKPLVSALITYLSWRLLVVVREHFGQKNTAKKTLIDDKFLF